MRVIYLAFGVVAAAAGLVDALAGSGPGHFVRGAITLLLGVVVFSLAGLLTRLEALTERLDRLERERNPAEREQIVAPALIVPSKSQPSSEQARAMLRDAQKHHFSKQFSEAKRVYQAVVERFPETKEANVARQQIENLKGAA